MKLPDSIDKFIQKYRKSAILRRWLFLSALLIGGAAGWAVMGVLTQLKKDGEPPVTVTEVKSVGELVTRLNTKTATTNLSIMDYELQKILIYSDTASPRSISWVQVPPLTYYNLEKDVLWPRAVKYTYASPDLQDQIAESMPTQPIYKMWQALVSYVLANFLQIVIVLLFVGMLFVSLAPALQNRKGKVIYPKNIKGDMDDLIGMEDIKREVLILQRMFENRAAYAAHNVSKPFNIMFTGPAGTGKTKLAGFLAKRLNLPIISASGSNLESGFVGGGSKAIQALYEKAKKLERCIIFLDEAQSLFMPRGAGRTKWDDDTSNTLLALLDGIHTEDQTDIIWVVATNFNENNIEMDEAMLRRFAFKIGFRLPNKKERIGISKANLEKKEASVVDWAHINLDHFGEITSNLSPAVIETIINRASFIAIEDSSKINDKSLFLAYERTMLGLTDRQTTEDQDKQRELIAIHELGHFFMQIHPLILQGMSLARIKDASSVLKISTESVSKINALGYVLSTADDVVLKNRDTLENDIKGYYGGVAAEEMFYGKSGITQGSHNDIQRVTQMLQRMVLELGMYSDAKVNMGLLTKEINNQPVIDKAVQLYTATLTDIQAYREAISVLKQVLLDKYVLTKDEIFAEIENKRLLPLCAIGPNAMSSDFIEPHSD